jgi:hypothetical protein
MPKTWDEYAQADATLHKANPTIYMADFPPGQGAQFTALAW